MDKINYSQLGRKLLKKHPDLAKELIESSLPAFNNFAMIPWLKEIYDGLIDKPSSTKETTNYRLYFIAVIIRLYDPDALSSVKGCMRDGLRKHLSSILQCPPTQISHLFRAVKDYTRIYPSFNEKVEYFYAKIDEHVFAGK